MANKSVVVLEKPVTSLSLADWHVQHNQIRAVGSSQRNAVCALRHRARNLSNQTDIQTTFVAQETNTKFDDRILELKRWHKTMTDCRDRVRCEMDILRTEKCQTERELEAMVAPLDTVFRSLSIRNNRLAAEMTHDDRSGVELKSELAVVETNKAELRRQCESAWEKLNALQEVLFRVDLDIGNKAEAIRIDREGLDLDTFCAGISYKTDPQRVPKSIHTYEGWLAYSKDLKQTVEHELKDTYNLRESLFVCREKCRNQLASQQDRTDHMLRRRIYETQRSINELRWQLLKSNEELQKCWNEIDHLERCHKEQCDKQRLAETRLEHRTSRSGMELCSDRTHVGLQEEVRGLEVVKRQLNDHINELKRNYNALHDHVKRVEADLENKHQSLTTDIHCLDEREKAKNFACSANQGTRAGRNLALSGLEKEIPDQRFAQTEAS